MPVDLEFVGEGLAPQSRSFKLPSVAAEAGPDVLPEREFTLTVLSHDPAHRRLLVAINWTTKDSSGTQGTSFWVDPYDFPLTNFSRVSRGERFSLVLDRYKPTGDGGQARLVLLVFPSSRSGAKDRPFIDDLVARLGQNRSGAPPPVPPASGAASARP
jgi:hypothetical protein